MAPTTPRMQPHVQAPKSGGLSVALRRHHRRCRRRPPHVFHRKLPLPFRRLHRRQLRHRRRTCVPSRRLHQRKRAFFSPVAEASACCSSPQSRACAAERGRTGGSRGNRKWRIRSGAGSRRARTRISRAAQSWHSFRRNFVSLERCASCLQELRGRRAGPRRAAEAGRYNPSRWSSVAQTAAKN